jgi:hypothetical protein
MIASYLVTVYEVNTSPRYSGLYSKQLERVAGDELSSSFQYLGDLPVNCFIVIGNRNNHRK